MEEGHIQLVLVAVRVLVVGLLAMLPALGVFVLHRYEVRTHRIEFLG